MPAPSTDPDRIAARRAALAWLGKRNLLLIVHDVSFPFSPGEDLGRGSPYSREALAFLRRVRELGFTGVQLGPQGRTTAANHSPYDGTLFSRDELAVAPSGLVDAGWLDADTAAACARQAEAARERADHELARRLGEGVLQRAFAAFSAAGGGALPEFRAFRAAHAAWLEPDGLHDALARQHGGAHQGDWREAVDRSLFAPPPGGEPAARSRRGLLGELQRTALERYAFEQFVVARQHAAWRGRLRELGLTVWGDLQAGISSIDAWRLAPLFLRDYLLGAPPSRTNPAGQPWGYPVLDPSGLGEDGAARALLRTRINVALQNYDGLRVDHPHGLVCPWVYRADAPDAYAAVRAGARLFESPDLPDHRGLAAFARVTPDQVRHDGTPRHADDWVVDLRPEQVDEYAALLGELVAAVGQRAGDVPAAERLALEVLSTQPLPLRAVTERLGLGRFRVTAKADPDDPRDVYASEAAGPEDWVMAGNHDTAPLWRLAREWQRSDRAGREARRLAARLGEPAAAPHLAGDPSALVHAKLADVLASPARNAMVFFADLFGIDALYNRPGEVHPDNWRLRVPSDWRRLDVHAAHHAALDIDRVLALALRMRGAAPGSDAAALVRRLSGA